MEMLIEPLGITRADVASRNKTFRCDICGRKMKKVEQEVVLAKLPLPQKIANQLGRICVEGWCCLKCQLYFDTPVFHLRLYPLNYWKEEKFCTICQEFTIDLFKELELGQFLLIEKCYCCELLKKLKEKKESIPTSVESISSWQFPDD